MLSLLLHVEKHADLDIQQEEAIFIQIHSFCSSSISVRKEEAFPIRRRQMEKLLIVTRTMRDPWIGVRALDNEHL